MTEIFFLAPCRQGFHISQNSRATRVFPLSMPKKLNPDHHIASASHLIPVSLLFQYFSVFFIFIFFFSCLFRPVRRSCRVGVNLFYITDREGRKKKKKRQYTIKLSVMCEYRALAPASIFCFAVLPPVGIFFLSPTIHSQYVLAPE